MSRVGEASNPTWGRTAHGERARVEASEPRGKPDPRKASKSSIEKSRPVTKGRECETKHDLQTMRIPQPVKSQMLIVFGARKFPTFLVYDEFSIS